MSSLHPRCIFVDHLGIVLTALVILHHAAIVYGGSGGWYWREETESSSRLLLVFNALNQSYFMGLFFLLAGYFTPASYDRKGAAQFVSDRLVRLGVPLVIYFFLLSPMTIALARTGSGHPFWSGWWQMIRGREFEPGPLWFAEALLIFALAYIVWRKLVPTAVPRSNAAIEIPRARTLAVAAVCVGAASFLIRLWVPVGTNVVWLQVGYFAPYIVLFCFGCAAARGRLLERVTLSRAKPWIAVSVVMFFLLLYFLLFRANEGSFLGGWTLNAAFYAWWDPFISWGIILLLLWLFRIGWSRESRLVTPLARCAFTAYIVHPPVLVGLSLAGRSWAAAPLLKFGVIGLASCVGAFAVASMLIRLPGARKVL